VLVFFKGLYHGIPWAPSCSNYSNSAKTGWQPCFDRCTRWILIISERVSLTITLEYVILTSLCIPVTLSQPLEQTALTYRSHLNLSIDVVHAVVSRNSGDGHNLGPYCDFESLLNLLLHPNVVSSRHGCCDISMMS